MGGDRRPESMRPAILGLVGALLTACGGLAGAVVSAAVTVWQVERQAHHGLRYGGDRHPI